MPLEDGRSSGSLCFWRSNGPSMKILNAHSFSSVVVNGILLHTVAKSVIV